MCLRFIIIDNLNVIKCIKPLHFIFIGDDLQMAGGLHHLTVLISIIRKKTAVTALKTD